MCRLHFFLLFFAGIKPPMFQVLARFFVYRHITACIAVSAKGWLVISAKSTARLKYSPQWVWYNQLEPLING
ncbi:MAG: hypothetical protein GX824_09250 [Clostridiales bacterium]|jgi:hypothetical protein|nr:hypothetical protein [Clostridiales bacterium]